MHRRTGGALTLVAAAALALPVAVAAVSSAAPSSSSAAASAPAVAVYGHVRSVVRNGSRFELNVDPAWWLTGVTARAAAVADKAVPPGQPVPNDYYIVDEGHRVLTYKVRAGARVTVLTRRGRGPIPATSISVAELAQIVKGRNPRHRQLLEPKAGFWLRVAGDTVSALDQQYQP